MHDASAHRQAYMSFHRRRATYLLDTIGRLGLAPSSTVLDVGRSPLTNLVVDVLPRVTTLGLPLDTTLLDKADPLDTTRVPHVVFDLNACADRDAWVLPGLYDLVLFNEVIEHLRVSPTWVFRYLRELLRPGAYLIVQTPNAASLGHRLKLLAGRNPFVEFALGGEEGAHHFREYTRHELLAQSAAAGLVLHEHRYVNYFPASSSTLGAITAATGLVPPFRNGQTLVLRRPSP